MEKIKLERRYEKEGRYVMGYAVEAGKNNSSAIITIAAYSQAEAEKKLTQAQIEMPPKFAKKYC